MALLAHWTGEDAKAASRSRSLALVSSAPVAELDLNLSWRETGSLPAALQCLPLAQAHRHNPAATDTHPAQARLADKTQDSRTHTITCVPAAPSTGPGIQQVLNTCLQTRWINQSKGPCACAHTAVGPLGRLTLPNTTAPRGAHAPVARSTPHLRHAASPFRPLRNPSVKWDDNTYLMGSRRELR